MKNYQLFLPYAVAIASTAIALMLALWLEPILSQSISVFFFVAITISTWYGTVRGGTVAIILSMLAINSFLIPLVWQFTDIALSNIFTAFFLVAVVIHLLSSNLRHSKRRAEQLSQQLLEKSAEQLQMVLSAAQIGVWDWNLVTGEINWSPEHEQLFGLTPGTFDGRYETFETFIHPDDREELNRAVEVALREKILYQHQFRIVWGDGSIHWVEARGRAFSDKTGQPVRMTGTVMAIDKRKQVQAKLQERETILALFAQYAPAGIAMFDREMRYLMASKRWLDEYHLDSIESIIGRSHYDIFPEIPERWRQIHQRCLGGAIEKCDEDLFVRLDGTQQWISWEIHPWYKPTGEIGGIIIFSTDITRRKQAESTLHETQIQLQQEVAELETIYHSAPIGLNVLDLELQAVVTRNMAEGICVVRADNGVIIYANPKFEQMFGYDSGDLKGLDISSVNYVTGGLTAEDIAQGIRSLVFQSGEATYEVQNVKQDGTPFCCRATCSVFNHPDYGEVLVAVHQDITEAKYSEAIRQQAEAALRENEAKFRSLFECSPVGIFMTDLQGQCIYTNQYYQEICGCTFDELLGKGFVQFLHPEDREQVLANWSQAIYQKQPFYGEFRYVNKQGIIRFVEARSALISSVSGELIGYVGTLDDVTERQAIEQMKNEFISIVSHELRTPLTSIRGSLGLLAAGIFKNKPETAQQMLEIANQDTERLVRLVNDILDLERLDAHKINLVKQWWDAEYLLQQSVKTLQSLARENKVKLCVESASVQVYCDSDRILQTLVNLVSNAIKFSPPESTVTLTVEDLADRVLFQVKDQGRGIPPDQLDSIFGRFQQIDVSDSRQKGGTGLGLAICKGIIQKHGGKIWARSFRGKGSRFCFTLPKLLD